MATNPLKPGVIWGQHRTTELLAIGIKDRLLNDSALAGLPFVEFDLWRIDDYVELLYLQEREGLSRAEFQRKDLVGLRQRVAAYERELRSQHGPLMFNLHDGNSPSTFRYDLEFWIPSYIVEDRELGKFLEETGQRHDLSPYICYHHPPSGGLVSRISPESIIVEFLLPEPQRLKRYRSEREEILVRESEPVYWAAGLNQFMVADTQNAVFQETVVRFADYMRDILIGLKDMTFTAA